MFIQWIVEGIHGDADSGYQSALASNRYRAILPAMGMEKQGHQVEFIAASHWMPGPWPADSAPDVIVIGKLLHSRDPSGFNRASDTLIYGALDARRSGIPVLADINDDHFEHPVLGRHWRGIVDAVDGVVAGSEAMAEVIRRHTAKPVFVIGDPVTAPYAEAEVYRQESGWRGGLLSILHSLGVLKSRLQLIWYGSPTNWAAMAAWADRLTPLASKQPFMLRVITQPGWGVEEFVERFNSKNQPGSLMEFIPWEQDTVWDYVQHSHIVLIPADLADKRKSVKTANRLAEALISGRSVVASPVPAYLEFSEATWLGDDILQGIRWCIAHPQEALEKIQRGQQLVTEKSSIDNIARQWTKAIGSMATQATQASINSVEMDASRVAQTLELTREHASPSSNKTYTRLNLGCGDKILDNYINVDVAPSRAGKKPNVLCDLHRLEPFANDSADEILSVHVIEHFWRWEVVDILKEWVRVLKPGGKLILECPNLTSACQAFLNAPLQRSRADQNGQTTMWVFYGDPGWKDPLMVHRWGYTPESLGEVMREAGLIDIRQEPAQFKLREPRDMRMVGMKPVSVTSTTFTPPTISTDSRMNKQTIQTSSAIQRIEKTPQAIWDEYLIWYYHAYVWKQTYYHGIRTLKLPGDMWNYQEILFDRGIDYVVETGTRHGGSALFFAETLAARKAAGFVISIDVDAHSRQVESHERIRFLVGDSGSSEMVAKVQALVPHKRGPLFLILDSDHAKAHVLRELAVWVPFLRPGDYLVVEDTDVNGHPVRPDHGPGPWEAIHEYLDSHPDSLMHDRERERKFGATSAPDGYYYKL